MKITELTKMKSEKNLTRLLQIFLPISCCLVLANLYYAQPILTDISKSIGISPSQSGFILTASQIGYCLGVIFLVPMGDVFRNKTLIVSLVLLTSLALLAAGLSESSSSFLISTFFVGVFSCAVQVIVPFGVGIAAPAERGKITGLIVAGALLGIAVSRVTASAVVACFEWRSIYFGASLSMVVLGVCPFYLLPAQEVARTATSYTQAIKSMGNLLSSLPKLRSRFYYQASIFACFTMFWASAPIVLKHQLGMSHTGIALISLASLAAPVGAIYAGRLIDQGKERLLTAYGLFSVASAFLATPIFGIYALVFLIAILLLDPGVVITNVVSQQSVLSMVPEARSRLNALYVAGTFMGGAVGSYIGPWIYSHYGWSVLCALGALLVGLAFVVDLRDRWTTSRIAEANSY